MGDQHPRYGQEMPGYHASTTQPGTPNVVRLREIAHSGRGELQAQALAAQRLFRTEKRDRPAPHVMDVKDVTRNLPLSSDQAGAIEHLLTNVRADYGSGTQLRTPRIAQARTQFSSVINSMGIDGSVRMELQRRALAYWRRNGSTDYERKPMIRHVISKAQGQSPTLLKADEDQPEKPPSKGEEPKGKDGEGYNPINVPQGPGGPKGKKKEKPKLTAKIEEHDEGHTVHIGEGENAVEANLHKDSDYQHHATEYAKHSAMHKMSREHNPEKAEAHRHAANMHAKIANALHQAGQTNPHPTRGMQAPEDEAGGEPDIFGGDALAEHMPGADGGPPPIQQGSPGMDAEGNPLPAEPDGVRNEPGQDSENNPAQAEIEQPSNQGQVAPSPGEAGPPAPPGKKGKPTFGKSMVFVVPKPRSRVRRIRGIE